MSNANAMPAIALSRKGVLVIGGGVAGIQSALDLAHGGAQVFLIERTPESFTLPSYFQTGEACQLDLGSVNLDLCVPYAACGDFKVTTETGRDRGSAWLDVILYRGEEREISFGTLKEAAVVFALRMRPAEAGESGNPMKASTLVAKPHDKSLSVVWNRDEADPLALDVPTVPQPHRALRSAAKAHIGARNAWE